MSKLSKILVFLLINILFSVSAQAQSELADEVIEAENNVAIGRWVKSSPSIKEYPVCYQIWTCESGTPIIGESISLPKGEWGLCENYADTTRNNICTKCDAPPPTEVCE